MRRVKKIRMLKSLHRAASCNIIRHKPLPAPSTGLETGSSQKQIARNVHRDIHSFMHGISATFDQKTHAKIVHKVFERKHR